MNQDGFLRIMREDEKHKVVAWWECTHGCDEEHMIADNLIGDATLYKSKQQKSSIKPW